MFLIHVKPYCSKYKILNNMGLSLFIFVIYACLFKLLKKDVLGNTDALATTKSKSNDAPATTKSKSNETSKSYILSPPHHEGHVMPVKCEQPLDEHLTVQVWLLYHHPSFKYCILYVGETELQTDRQTDKLQNLGPSKSAQTQCHKLIYEHQ